MKMLAPLTPSARTPKAHSGARVIMVTVETPTRRVKVKLLEVVKDDSELLRQKLASSVQSESSSLLDLCSTL